MREQRRVGPALPKSLVEELQAKEGGPGNKKRTKGAVNRKAERKAERQTAKQKKADFFSQSRVNQAASAKRATPEDYTVENDRRPSKRRKRSTENDQTVGGGRKDEAPEVRRKKDKKAVKIQAHQDPDILDHNFGKSRREEEEDAYIAMLEKRLGVGKTKSGKSKYKNELEQDGLLDLLSDLDREYDDFPDEPTDSEGSFIDRSTSPGASSSASNIDEGGLSDIAESWSGFASSDDNGLEGEFEEEAEEETKSSVKVNNLSTTSKYVPPQLRNTLESSQPERDAKLHRVLKGHLNKLSEQNIDTILKEIEAVYRQYRRHDVTSTLTEIIIEGTCFHSSLLDSYVALHAGLVACLHKIIGIDFAAYFVQTLVGKFEDHYSSSRQQSNTNSDEETVGKECSNLLVLLIDLYNYHVIACTLLFDVIRLILENDLAELDVELILKVAKGTGSQLRQDDPSALKDIIQIVQSKLADQAKPSSRTRFMVETLNNLKNNKLKHGANAHGSSDSKERITKFVAGIGKKYHVQAHEPLRVSLNDLHHAGSKGKWWLVGAAWGGDPLAEQQGADTQNQSDVKTADEMSSSLIKLARKQGMNTDVRRSIFVVLMSSEDYVDACDRLAQLNLTDIQQREIIRVLLHCCGNEKVYNPYYTLIGQHLCRQSHSHRVTLQYCFWDFLRSLGETKVGGEDMVKAFQDDDGEQDQDFEIDRISKTRIANVARAFAWWVAKDCSTIAILKTLDFIMLKKKTAVFLTQFFTNLFVYSQDSSSVPSLAASADTLNNRDAASLATIFVKALRVPTLAQGILHFISTAFSDVDTSDELGGFTRWASDTAKDALRRALETSKT